MSGWKKFQVLGTTFPSEVLQAVPSILMETGEIPLDKIQLKYHAKRIKIALFKY